MDDKLFAELVKSVKEMNAIRRGDATFAAAGGPDAYFGFPAEATAEEGHAIIETLGAILAEAVVEAMGPTGVAS